MLTQLFNKKESAINKAFIPFIMAGHPSMNVTQDALLALANANVDVIELGVPFSDPVADGVVNQRAAEMALRQGVSLASILCMVKAMRQNGFVTPIILFSYFNPIFAMGIDVFVQEAIDAGIHGVLIVDLPPEEGEAFYNQLKKAGLDMVLLVSPTTNVDRFEYFKQFDPLFIYYISRCAVTGMQQELPRQLQQEVAQLKSYFPHHPVMVGFGISTPAQAGLVAEISDGVVVGSALVNTLEHEGLVAFEKLTEAFVKEVQTTDRGAQHVD